MSHEGQKQRVYNSIVVGSSPQPTYEAAPGSPAVYAAMTRLMVQRLPVFEAS